MADFFHEEIVFIFISLFVLGITVFVVTRDFMPKKSKIAIPVMIIFLTLGLVFHYQYRKNNMQEIKEAFENNKTILCVDKTNRASGQVVINKRAQWSLKDDLFIHPAFDRGYNIRQCIVER